MQSDKNPPENSTTKAILGDARQDFTNVQILPVTNVILAGRGLFSSPEDVAALDAAVALAYEERRSSPPSSSSL